MTDFGASPGAAGIGEIADTQYALLPDPSKLYRARSQRLRSLAAGHVLEPYLSFAAAVTEAQHEIQAGLPEAVLPPMDRIREATANGMPPIGPGAVSLGGEAEALLSRLLGGLCGEPLTPEARAAVESLASAAPERRHQLLEGAAMGVPAGSTAERVFILASLQVYFSRLASRLRASDLKPIADGLCPACGSPPVSSSVVGWPKAHNLRFCTCSLCAAMWNVVRVKCVFCGSTGGIGYHSIEGRLETVKAETCDHCRQYLKILYQVKDHALDPLSDDVATLDLDMVLAAEGWRRGGHNLFLLGY
jgi:FdhE protein